jgi:pimeloyl-ACP methyl ester carboxylesterase
MKHSLIFAAVLALAAPAFSHAADTAAAPVANRMAASIAPAEKFEAGTMLVERHGDHGTPMILIPGLSSGPWAWQETIREFKKDHVVYVVTLPGFDGRPAIQGDLVASALDSLKTLIVSRKLAKPVLVGHSLGSTLSIDFAEQNPALVGGVVGIDGLPVFPGTEMMPAEQRPQMAAAMKARMASTDPKVFEAQQVKYMRAIGSIDMGKADDMAKLSAGSDPASVGNYAEALLKLDLRKDLPKISAPVLIIAPYYEPDHQAAGITLDNKTQYIAALMGGTPKLKVTTVAPARHFAQIDQPKQVNDAIASFLKTL